MNFIRKEFLSQVLSSEFCENFKNTYFVEHLRRSASVYHVCTLLKEIHLHEKLHKQVTYGKAMKVGW